MKPMMRLVAMLGLTALASVSIAAVPSQMTIQGRLTDNTTPLTDDHVLQFRIFDVLTGGSPLWEETQSITVTNGLFSAELGKVTPLAPGLFSSEARWLEITVDGTTLNPRQPLVSVPYAFRAAVADVALSAPAPSDLWSTDGTDVWRPGGNVGIGGTPEAGHRLRVANGSIKLDNNWAIVWRDATNSSDVGAIHYDNNNRLHFRPGALDQMTVTSGGNVGIAAPNPTANFDLHGRFRVTADQPSPDRWSLTLGDGTGWKGHLTKDDGTKLVTFQDNGSVGIGVTNPASALDVAGSFKLRLQPTGNNSGMSFNTAPESPSIGFHASDNSQRFTLATNISANNGDDLLRFDGSIANSILALKGNGNAGIGTQSPKDRLEVAGNLTIGAYDGTLNDVVLRAAGGCPNCGSNSEGGSHLVLRSGIGTGSAASGDIVFQVSDDVNYGNQQPHGILEAMRIQTTTKNVSMSGNLTVAGSKCRVVQGTGYGDLYFNATESAHALFTTEGEAQLTDGSMYVNLDPKWLAGVTIDEKHPMQVWITFYGPHGDYYVERDHDGFKVIDPSGSIARFGWKVEARQKGYEDLYLNQPPQSAAKLRPEPTGSR